jgi:hypothetical protein
MTDVPANVAAARQQVIGSDYYALGYLALCIASYSDAGESADKIKAAIAANVPTIGQIGDVPGTWTLDWGPAITTSILSWKANLMFAASYRDPASNLPLFSAVVIRGTDITAGFLGVLKQIHEDLEPGCQLIWPTAKGLCANETESASITPYISRGTHTGFKDLIGLQGLNQSTQQTQVLGEFLDGWYQQYANDGAPLPMVVTGHSLGGCQTSPIAFYAYWAAAKYASGVTIVPNSFAAPTAGNGGFVDEYLRLMPNARRWYNTFDIVPMAFDSLTTMPDLWSVSPYSCGISIPDWATVFVDLFKTDVGNLTYRHEQGSAVRALTGICGSTGSSKDPWGAELEYQHFPPCGYWNLMVNQYASSLGSLQYPPWVTPAPACS